MLITDFITGQFKKAGVEMSAEMKEALNNPELTKVNLDDTLVKNVNEKLLTFDVAKENPILKQHFRFTTLNPIDTDIHERILAEYGINDGSPELAAAIKAEKNTYEKIQLALKAVKDLEAKKATATVGDKKALVEQIDKLNADILTEKARAKAEKDTLINENKNRELDWNIRGSFAAYNYSDQFEKSDAIELGVINLRKQLNQDGAKIILDPMGSLKLVSSADPSLDFTKENQKVGYQEYIDKLVADKKLIKISDSGNTGNQPGQPLQPNQIPNNYSNEPVNVGQSDILKELSNQLGIPVNSNGAR